MIQTQLSTEELKSKLAKVVIKDDEHLISSAGFSIKSGLNGQPRKTFSLIMNPEDIIKIKEDMQVLYARVCDDTGFEKSDKTPLPFDFVRVDAFYNSAKKELKVLEINGRGAGMHEISEVCDLSVAETLGIPIQNSLNDQIVTIQKIMQEAVLGPINNLLYITSPAKPKWLYFQAIERSYDHIDYVTSYGDVQCADNGIVYKGKAFTAITAKASGGIKKPFWELNDAGVISIMQPRTTKPVGVKSYLNNLDFDFVPKSTILNAELHHFYVANQLSIVLKKDKSSGATGVIVGIDVSPRAWNEALINAYEKCDDWQIQDYVKPGEGSVVGHSGCVNHNNKVLLGIFLMPDIYDPLKVVIDFSVKLYDGSDKETIFDPADSNDDIWFGNVVVSS